jgi:(p)ppGpp synthase/HD superfamily hydrolase
MALSIEDAISHVAQLHKGQKDLGGTPYIWHPIRVAMVQPYDLERIVALYHDTLEDTELTIEQLEDRFPDRPDVVEAIKVLTHEKNEPYEDYIERISKNAVARKVKLADLEDNMDPNRLGREPTVKDQQRYLKYKRSWFYLMSKAV